MAEDVKAHDIKNDFKKLKKFLKKHLTIEKRQA